MRGSPEGMWGTGGNGPEGATGRRAGEVLDRGGFGQGMGPPAFPWKRQGVSAEGRRSLWAQGHLASASMPKSSPMLPHRTEGEECGLP